MAGATMDEKAKEIELEEIRAQNERLSDEVRRLDSTLAEALSMQAELTARIEELERKSSANGEAGGFVSGTVPQRPPKPIRSQTVDPDSHYRFGSDQNPVRYSLDWAPSQLQNAASTAPGSGPLQMYKFNCDAESGDKVELKDESSSGSGSSSGSSTTIKLVGPDGNDGLEQSSEKYALPVREKTQNGFKLLWAKFGGTVHLNLPPGSSVGPCAPTYSMRVYGCKLQLVRQNRKLIDGGTPGEESSCQNDGDPVVVAEINMSDFQSCFGGMVPPPDGAELTISPVELTVCVPNSSSGINYRKITVLAAGGITNWLSFTSCS